jgi:hypothetical protein
MTATTTDEENVPNDQQQQSSSIVDVKIESRTERERNSAAPPTTSLATGLKLFFC